MAKLPTLEHRSSDLTARNEPFRSWIRYRVDDYSSQRHWILEQLRETFPDWNPGLEENRGEQDLGVAFAELYAYMAEILSFYQDCRANEAFLRTATLPASLIELGALIDYRLLPGASASTLQVFLLKEDESGKIPERFQVKTKAKSGKPALVFETDTELDADAALNVLRFDGYDRSLRTLNGTTLPARSWAKLHDRYNGLKAGSYLVFDGLASDSAKTPFTLPAQLTSATFEDEKTVVHWEPSTDLIAKDAPIADLTIHGKPKQQMVLAERDGADQVAVGQTRVALIDDGAFSVNQFRRVLFASQGLLYPAKILAKSGNVITINRAFNTALRRTETRAYVAPFLASAAAIRRGVHAITTYTFSSPPAPGDYVILSDPSGEVALRVASATSPTVYLADPVPRAFPSGAWLFRTTLADPEHGIAGSTSSAIAPLMLAATTKTLVLDKEYEGLEPGALVVIADGITEVTRKVKSAEVDEEGRTELELDSATGASLRVATTTIHGPFEEAMRVDGYDQTEESSSSGDTSIVLSGIIQGLKPGGYVVIEGGSQAEGARVTAISRIGGATVVDLEEALKNAYPKATTSIFGNVVPVSHGVTVDEELLGSGDHSQPNQQFKLSKKQVTFVHDAEGPRGLGNTLEFFVDDERWREVESLAEAGSESAKADWVSLDPLEVSDERQYTVDIDEDERMTVVTGDGRYGAKLVTGRDNVRARYRSGLGADGNVDADEVAKIVKAMAFLDSTRNPVEAAGGADRQTVEDVKRIAPVTVRTLDRAVSLSDYADLALAYAGIAKARADWEWEGLRRVIVLTVAAADGQILTLTLKKALSAYLDARRSPEHRLSIRDHGRFPVRLELTVHVREDFLQMETLERVQDALGSGVTEEGERGYFHFDRLELGQDLYLSDVYSLVEGVRGVDYLVVDAFGPDKIATAGTELRDRVLVPVNSVPSGGDPVDEAVGILSIKAVGGIR